MVENFKSWREQARQELACQPAAADAPQAERHEQEHGRHDEREERLRDGRVVPVERGGGGSFFNRFQPSDDVGTRILTIWTKGDS